MSRSDGRAARRTPAAIVAALVALLVAGADAFGGDTPRPKPSTLPGLESSIAEIALAAQARGPAAGVGEARLAGLDTSGTRVEIVVRTQPGFRQSALAALTARGGQVVRSSGMLVKALVPVAELGGLGRAPGVERLEAPQRFHVASLDGEGVAASNAAVAHADGERGAGVKIGIVDVGFGQYTLRQSAGELPTGGALKTQNYCSNFEQHLHGTAVAEVIHEVAPAAELHLICIEDAVDLAAATDYAIANGIQLMNESGGFFNTSRGDGSGGPDTPDGIVARARAAGILWVASAGNYAKFHWSGSFADADGDGLAEFAPGDEGNDFLTRGGELICAYLKWDSWPTTALDYDLLLQTAAGAPLGGSSGPQTGSQPPTEAFCFTPSGHDETFSLAIRGPSGSTPMRFDVFLLALGRGTLQHQTAAGSLSEPASGPQALAAAAVCWESGTLASYSSQGPAVGGGLKPDLAGFDSVSSTTYGSFTECEKSGFTGTSAAAPHIVGTAAILKQRHPGLGPAELQAALEASAADLGAAGKDAAYGAGRLRLAVRPTPATSQPSAIGRRTAVLAGTVEPHRWPGSAYFEYSTDAGFSGLVATAPVAFVPASGGVAVSASVDGLTPLTTYFARLVVQNEHGLRRGSAVSFSTVFASAPIATNGAPTSRTQAGVTLNGFVNANNAPASFTFEYGPTPSLGASTPAGSVGGDATEPVSAVVTGLAPGTLYYFRLSATNSHGSGKSPVATFTTLPNGPPLVTTGAASAIGTSTATVAATVNPNGNPTTYAFEFGLTAALGTTSPGASLPAGDTAQPVSAALSGLQPGTTYHYRVTATNSAGGPVAGATGSFATASPPPPPPPPPPPAPPPPPVGGGGVTPPASPAPALPAPAAPAGRTWSGSSAANVFRGSRGPDVVDGRGGNDRLFGGAGNDRITGGGGRDRIDAGPGNDRILARDRTRDTIRCGGGRDTVVADRIDTVARDCEVVRRS